MALGHSDFMLTDSELMQINKYILSCARMYADEGEDAPMSVGVVFNFGVPFGREMGVIFDGAVHQTWMSDLPGA